MRNKTIFSFILFLFLFNLQIFSVFTIQSPSDQDEFDTIFNLVANLGLISYAPISDGLYNFCSSPMLPLQIICQSNSIISLQLAPINQFELNSEHFKGLKSLEILYLQDATLSSTFLSGTSFPNPDKLNLLIFTTAAKNPNGVVFSQMSIANQIFSIEKQPQTEILFSTFKQTSLYSRLIFQRTGPIGTEFSFNNNLVNPLHIDELELISNNFPSFNKVSGNVTIFLSTGYDKLSFSNNIVTIKDLTYIKISSEFDESNEFPLYLGSLNNNNLVSIEFNMPFKTPLSNIDLSQLKVNKLSLINVGRLFKSTSLGIPLTLSNNLLDFSFNGGNIQNFNPQLFKNLKNLDLSDNQISNTLPQTWDTSLKLISLKLNYNNFSGTIDKSYCQLDLSLINNPFIIGLAPPCFSCFFSIPLVGNGGTKSKFIGTNISQLDNISCELGSIIPKLKYSGYSNSKHILYISGESLGSFGIENILNTSINDQGYNVRYFVEIPNTLIRIETNSSDPSISSVPKIFKFQYINPVSPFPIFTLSWETNIKPNVISVDYRDTIKMVIKGTHFTYNISDVKVIITNGLYGSECLVNKPPTWDTIECTYAYGTTLSNLITTVTIGGLTTQFIVSQGIINPILSCSTKDDCNYEFGNGYCDTTIGECVCKTHYREEDNCKVPFIPCEKNCGNDLGYGVCNNQTGICSCTDPLRNILDCYPKECSPQCANNGTCNQYTGLCICVPPYVSGYGYCTVINHFASAVIPSNDTGGTVIFFGLFGNKHDEVSVEIGLKNCPVQFINETVLICIAPPGKGTAKLVISQNKIFFISKVMYKYISTEILTCPNNCTSTINGNCNTTNGYCNCINDWYGYDCSLFKNVAVIGGGGKPISKPTIDNSTGETEINNENTNFQLSITSLLEIDIDGKTEFEYPLQSNWNKHKNQSTTTITKDSISYIFTQTIQNGTCNITYTISEILIDKSYQFAGIDYKISQGSIKMTIEIKNYIYSSNMNTLQLQMKSTVNGNNNNDCNNKETEIENINDIDNQSLNFITIKKDSKILSGRFINRIESDGRPTSISTSLISKDNSSIVLGMNLPHCIYICNIDPDFSVLLSNDYNTDCSSSRKWVIPVAVVISIVGAATIGTALFFILKKNTTIKVQLHKLKRLNK